MHHFILNAPHYRLLCLPHNNNTFIMITCVKNTVAAIIQERKHNKHPTYEGNNKKN